MWRTLKSDGEEIALGWYDPWDMHRDVAHRAHPVGHLPTGYREEK